MVFKKFVLVSGSGQNNSICEKGFNKVVKSYWGQSVFPHPRKVGVEGSPPTFLWVTVGTGGKPSVNGG